MSVPKPLQRRASEIEGWLSLNCPERALAKLGPLFDTPGARPAALYYRVSALVALGRHDEALADLGELRGFDPDPEWLDLTEAWCLKRVDRIQDAAHCMERLIERTRRSAIGHFNLGCYLALLGETDRALDEVAVACGIDDSFRGVAADETDLDSLRGDPRFEQLLV